jgi:hypothetical protein
MASLCLPTLQARQLQFGLIEVRERIAEVNQHQVALVADERVQGRLSGGVFLHRAEDGRSFLGDRRSVRCGERAPGRPAYTHHLVEHAVAFGG